MSSIVPEVASFVYKFNVTYDILPVSRMGHVIQIIQSCHLCINSVDYDYDCMIILYCHFGGVIVYCIVIIIHVWDCCTSSIVSNKFSIIN